MNLKAIFKHKCPACTVGDLFVHKNLYSIKKIGEMHDKCPSCAEDFKREPGFYFGAAYVSYAITIALWVAVLVALYVFSWMGLFQFGFLTHPKLFLITGILTLLILLPVIYRTSRVIWLSLFVK